MSDLGSYLQRLTDPIAKERLEGQWRDAVRHKEITCFDCGYKRSLELAYRCLYCGIWFCVNCAEAHFGKTIQNHIVEKRREKRKQFEEQLSKTPWPFYSNPQPTKREI